MRSGVQLEQGEVGAFAGWYAAATGIYPFAYSEITGYALTLIAWRMTRGGDDEALRSATSAGSWLLSAARNEFGGFSCGVPLAASRFRGDFAATYSFDTGIITNGLINLYRFTGDDRYLRAASRAIDWLLQCQQPDGSFPAVFDREGHAIEPKSKGWSTVAGPHHAKVALSFINMHALCGDSALLRAARQAAAFAVSRQSPRGAFVTWKEEGATNVHAHCYASEALWAIGNYVHDSALIDRAARATRLLLSVRDTRGRVPRHLIGDRGSCYAPRTDVLSQMVRLMALLRHKIDADELYCREQLRGAACEFQVRGSRERRLKGGFWFGSASDGTMTADINTCSTIFAVQALALDASPDLVTDLALDPWLLV